ncbi:MAG: LOG family protein [Anaerolineae bacterium]|nr:LOG family protein [Anaerolineae bacterium]MDW8299522.1 LOG family protein [Anaerolineae bacterium]
MTESVRRKVIGVFGSASLAADTPEYAAAQRLGAQLAQRGYAVMTGGYGGAMGAVSEGAARAGGHVIGVTVGLFRARGLVPNPFLHEEVQFATLAERLNYLITAPDAYVALQGGVGTLSEIALAWSLLQVQEIPLRPLIAVGEGWRAFAEVFAAHAIIRPEDMAYLQVVLHAEDVVSALEAWWANPPRIVPRLGDVQKTPPLGDLRD